MKRVRVLIGKVGLDGHDVGARVVARGLLDAGMEVIYTGLRRTPEQIVQAAIEEDADVIGISLLSGSHLVHVRRIREILEENDATDIILLLGGVVPVEDIPELEAIGVQKVFLSGTSISEIASFITQAVGTKRTSLEDPLALH